MSKPAARVGDFHSCPKAAGPVPHVGGPVQPPGAKTVLIDGKPAATEGCAALCTGAADGIAEGSPTVLFESKRAARKGDRSRHGGRVMAGSPKCLIGDAPKYERLAAGHPWQRENTLAHLRKSALTGYSKNCGRWVREALEAGGIEWTTDPRKRPVSGKDFGPELHRHGFVVVTSGALSGRGTPMDSGFAPRPGDVIVLDRVPDHEDGHVAMYDGREWISDARQGGDPIPHHAYAEHHGQYSIYRRP